MRRSADLDVAVGGHRAEARDEVDAVLLEQAGHAAGQRLDDLLRRSETLPKSIVGSPVVMPYSSASRTS
jgi:hypothetical protein